MPNTGGAQFRALAVRLNAAADKTLKAQLRTNIRAATEILIGDVKAAALRDLPKSGGLNEHVANFYFRTSTLLSGRNTGIRLVTRNPDSKGGNDIQFGTDKGVFRHPVFGNRKVWVSQTLDAPGWWTSTLDHSAPTVAPFIAAAMKVTAEEVCRKL